MWKKRILYCVLTLGLMRLGVLLYSTMSPVLMHENALFSQSSSPKKTYSVLPEHYDQEFKRVIERDINSITDATGTGYVSELDVYIGLLLIEKEKQYPGFAADNKREIEALRLVVIEYVRMYTTLCNQEWSDVGPKSSKREIQSCVRNSGHQKIKPLLDQLMYIEEEDE